MPAPPIRGCQHHSSLITSPLWLLISHPTRHIPRPHVTCNLMCLLIFCRAVIKMIYWRHWNTRLLHTPRVPDDNQRSSTSVQNLSKAMLSWWCCCLVPTPVTVPGQGGDDVWATELWGMTTDQATHSDADTWLYHSNSQMCGAQRLGFWGFCIVSPLETP